MWPILDGIFNLNLEYKNNPKAIQQRKDFLRQRNIGICDIVSSAKRKKIDASDVGMQDVVLRDLIEIIKKHPTVTQLLFTGGNSKNGPEYFFRKLVKEKKIIFKNIQTEVPRIHSFKISEREITTVSLTAPSGAANRAVGSLKAYKKMKEAYPHKTTIDFRMEQYAPFI